MASRVMCPIKTALSMRGLLVYDRYDHKSTLLERGLPVYDQDIQVYVYIKITSVITDELPKRNHTETRYSAHLSRTHSWRRRSENTQVLYRLSEMNREELFSTDRYVFVQR